jgi:primosomal protein N' (replication factor Y)
MPKILIVALPTPLRRLFEYLPNTESANVQPGMRVEAPFGKQVLVGIVVDVADTATYALDKLRPIHAVLDKHPVLPPDIIALCRWTADYYQHPPGEVFHAALPTQLRKIETAPASVMYWRHTTKGKGLPEHALRRSPKQQQVHQLLLQHGRLSEAELKAFGVSRTALRSLLEKDLICSEAGEPVQQPAAPIATDLLLAETPQQLNQEQQIALDRIRYHHYQTYLLEGATGSGKTEVYLHAIARTLQAGKQVLMLVPETGLAPQTLSRFRNRFRVPIVQLHSHIAEVERANNWRAAANGEARIVIGTRLAVFTPMPNLGLIILDEEHDLSFKQQDGLRYSARDLAVMRAYKAEIPLVLGSATPSLESLQNALGGRYEHLQLKDRAGGARAPKLETVDMRHEDINSVLSVRAMTAIRQTLGRGEQVLVFINRRGFAPALLCRHCGWVANCTACSARMTLHSQPYHLHCHHCDLQRPVPKQCPSCNYPKLAALGQGTERCEAILQHHFPEAPVLRVDQDSMRRKTAMADLNQRLEQGEPCILVGTQMLAKGHHFPKVTLAILLDVDQGLFSGDFRGPERMGQQLIQVAGRAGRGDLPGTVLLQTYQPDHPLLQLLLREGYHAFAQSLLQERSFARLPPHWAMALMRAESKRAENAVDFLKQVLQIARTLRMPGPDHAYLGPLPALMEKCNHRFRFQLQISNARRGELQLFLKNLVERVEALPLAQRVRWSLDVDPQDMS